MTELYPKRFKIRFGGVRNRLPAIETLGLESVNVVSVSVTFRRRCQAGLLRNMVTQLITYRYMYSARPRRASPSATSERMWPDMVVRSRPVEGELEVVEPLSFDSKREGICEDAASVFV